MSSLFGPSPAGASESHTFSVAEFAQLLRDQLAAVFPTDVWIQGEVRGISRPASGHVYFDLVDPTVSAGQSAEALVSIVLMKTTKQIVNRQIRAAGGGVRIADGVQVRLRGAPDFYAPRGQFQLRMNAIDPSYTLGQLAAAREQLLRKLAAEGILSRNRELAMPIAPRRVGLVTASGSAAAADFVHELEASSISWDVVLSPSPMQGDAAPMRIAAAIRECVRRDVDVVALVRGGGARTDLVAFDHEIVARAIVECPVPVLTGIGHEVDVSVADEVAHGAFKTPTACAAHLVAEVASATRRADELWDAITGAARAVVEREHRRVDACGEATARSALSGLARADRHMIHSATTVRHGVERHLDRRQAWLERQSVALRLGAGHGLDRARTAVARAITELPRLGARRLDLAAETLDHLDERRRLLDPARALARGWSITTKADGAIVKSAADVSAGDPLLTRVADGVIASTVEPGNADPTGTTR
jgi:exodeoxyribonuclease VII large subunit